MRIINFYSENFKRLKVVEFDPDKNIVVIAGKNGEGKSSILDAIWATFKHAAAKKTITEPIRHGELHAKNIITTDDYVITRTFKDGGASTLRIETTDGNIVKSPQALLDKIVGEMSFDPLTFANARDAERRQMIEDIFDLDLAEYAAKDHALKEEKKDKARELKMIDGRLRAIKPPTGGEPTMEASAGDLISQLSTMTNAVSRYESLGKEFDEIERRLDELTARREAICAERDQLEKIGDKTQLPVKIEDLKAEIGNIESRNARAREIQEYMKQRDLHDAATREVNHLKSAIELNKIERDEAIENADIPIDGLTIEENGVFLSGIPFDQISQAQKIKASLAIAIAANPELRVIRIMDGSLLDSVNLKMVEEMAVANDMQIWIERVDESGKVGIVIEDGEIKTQN